jgi:hypothetical protein
MTTVSIMQPYFLPFAGYFRLFAASDVFVLLDDVQFPRRGWVHRNRLHNRVGDLAWLTLPLSKGARDSTRIIDLGFRADGVSAINLQKRQFPLFDNPADGAAILASEVVDVDDNLCNYLHRQLDLTCNLLGLAPVYIRSSQLDIDHHLRGWERLVEIVRALKGDTYINLPGGQELYDPRDFRSRGIQIRFLKPYQGPTESILQRVHDSGADVIRAEIDQNLQFFHG